MPDSGIPKWELPAYGVVAFAHSSKPSVRDAVTKPPGSAVPARKRLVSLGRSSRDQEPPASSERYSPPVFEATSQEAFDRKTGDRSVVGRPAASKRQAAVPLARQ